MFKKFLFKKEIGFLTAAILMACLIPSSGSSVKSKYELVQFVQGTLKYSKDPKLQYKQVYDNYLKEQEKDSTILLHLIIVSCPMELEKKSNLLPRRLKKVKRDFIKENKIRNADFILENPEINMCMECRKCATGIILELAY